MKGYPFTALRLFVTGFYLVALGFAFAWVIDGRGMPFPFAAAAYTFVYGVLMMLMWLYERHPTR
jgi:hypothetical protein